MYSFYFCSILYGKNILNNNILHYKKGNIAAEIQENHYFY